jgi:hypothetical protein
MKSLDRLFRFLSSAVLLSLGLTSAACGSKPTPANGPATVAKAPPTETTSTVKQPREPSPDSVTRDHPGGDAPDQHEAALRRLLLSPWGARNDKDDQVHAPTPDWEHWKRVRYYNVEHFTGFRYGKDHHAIGIVFIQKMPPGTPVKSELCLREFEAWGRPQIKGIDVKFGPFSQKLSRWRDQTLVIQSVDGRVNWGFAAIEFSAAWAAYPAYPDACLVYAVALPWRGHADLARAVRDRWVTEGFVFMNPLTEQVPYRR